MTRKTREQFAQIIEREFRKAVQNDVLPVHVDMCPDEEMIRVTYRKTTYECDCDNDEEFIFVCRENPTWVVRFPIPADYLAY
jgi:hypothetical protein